MKKYIPCLVFLLQWSIVNCQLSIAQQPIPAKPQEKAILLLNGNAHLGNGTVIPKSAIAFDKGKITLVSDADKLSMDKSVYEVIDVTGKEIYPGLIAPNTIMGMCEIELVRSTNDFYETGSMNPNVRSIISYNTDSKVTPTVRSNGVLISQIVPQGGTISGLSSVVELDGWNWEDVVYKTDDGIHLNWPRMYIQHGWWAEPEDVQRSNTEKEIQKIRAFFTDAQAYSASTPSEKNLRFEAMRGLFTSRVSSGNTLKKLFIHTGYVKEMISAVNFSKEFGLKMVLVGAADAWMITDFLKENEVAVILGRTHTLPSRDDEDVDMPYKTPYLLQKAGVNFCLSVDGFWQVRNLPFMAGTAAANGLSKEEALMSITSNTAKILGIESTCGTLETGKDATLFISSGDALDMKTNNVELAFIRGKQIDLKNVQTALNKKFRDKYGLK